VSRNQNVSRPGETKAKKVSLGRQRRSRDTGEGAKIFLFFVTENGSSD